MTRALTLTQPWASAVAVGAKTVETRSWGTLYRGPLAIHAAKGLRDVGGRRGLRELCLREPFLTALGDWRDSLLALYRDGGATRVHGVDGSVLEGGPGDRLPLGAIVAVCELVDVVSIDELRATRIDADRWARIGAESALGDYSRGRYAWFLEGVRALPEPVPCRGALGLWTVPAGLDLSTPA